MYRVRKYPVQYKVYTSVVDPVHLDPDRDTAKFWPKILKYLYFLLKLWIKNYGLKTFYFVGKREERMTMAMSDVIKTVSKKELEPHVQVGIEVKESKLFMTG